MGKSPRGDRRRDVAHWTRWAAVMAALCVACAGPPSPSSPRDASLAESPSAALEPEVDYSAQRAWRHLEKLTKIGSRSSGTRDAERARRYLRSELEKIGAVVSERAYEVAGGGSGEATQIVHVVGILEGESPDVLLLAAHYDTAVREGFEFVGANDGASGPSVLLELGRLLTEGPRPFTIWLTFIDGDAIASDAEAALPSHVGSRALAAQLAASGELSKIRLAVFFNQVCDPVLTVARDLRSHPVFRQVFWDSASDLGNASLFAEEPLFDQPQAGHLAFLEVGMRRVVALVDDRFGGDTPPGVYWRSEHDTSETCSAQSMGVVVSVSHEALSRIEAQLEQIDHYQQMAPEPTDSLIRVREAELPAPQGGEPSVPGAPQASSGVLPHGQMYLTRR
jgi:hypothetical protein